MIIFSKEINPSEQNRCVSTNPTLTFCADTAIFCCCFFFLKIYILPVDPTCFQKSIQKFQEICLNKKNTLIPFFFSLAVENFIICRFFGNILEI